MAPATMVAVPTIKGSPFLERDVQTRPRILGMGLVTVSGL